MVDMLHPQTGMSTVKVLEHVGLEVGFPQAQTCCGQPGFNAGYRDEACRVAEQFLVAFADAEVIVTPSGSCAAMVRHEYPSLFANDPQKHQEAERLAAITWELTEFLVEGLGLTDLSLSLPKPTTFAFHDACHGLRLLGLGAAGRQLIAQIKNVTVVEMEGSDSCCGFGGLFSVKMADVSGAMLARKINQIQACPAQLLTGDVSCLTHINGGLARADALPQVQHIADILAAAIEN
jgi:L-lactate dehydrogenase complex protein LldE